MAPKIEISPPFNLALTLTMGQTFRWRPLNDGWLSGVVGPHLFHVRQADGGIEYEAASLTGHEDDPDQCLRRYFRTDDDIDAIYSCIARDPKVATIMREYPGLRLLRQEPWECLASQFCAERTDLGYTEDTVEYAAKLMGTELRLGDDVRYTFPTPRRNESDYRLSHAVWKWLLGSELSWNVNGIAKRVDRGEIDWDDLRRQSYLQVRRNLLQIPGVSGKIADCVALFALDKLEAFPVDKWVWRAITEAYPEWGFPEKSGPADHEQHEASKRARQEFGEYAGYANQYLFYWRRRHGDEPLSFAHRWHGKFRLPTGMTVDDARYEYLSRKYLS